MSDILKGWCIENPFHQTPQLMGWTYGYTRKQAIENYILNLIDPELWDHYRKQGFRAVKVTIRRAKP